VFLGERASRAIEEVAASVKPGDTEAEVVGRLLAELWKDRIDATGYLAAADDRARLYRHPVPTMRKVERCLLLSVNARFKGLIVSVTRMVHLGRPPEELMKQYRDNLLIEATMIAGTRRRVEPPPPGRAHGVRCEGDPGDGVDAGRGRHQPGFRLESHHQRHES